MSAAATDRYSTRAPARVLWGAALALLVLRLGLGFWEDRHPPVFPTLINWVPAGKADELSKEQKVPILLVFSASWCGPCKRMDKEVFGDPKVAEKIKEKFIPVEVMEGGSPGRATAEEAEALQKLYEVGGYPTLVVTNAPDHDPVTKTGYEGPEATRRFLLGGWRKKQIPTSFKDMMAEMKRAMDGGMRSDGGHPRFNPEEYDLPGDGGVPEE